MPWQGPYTETRDQFTLLCVDVKLTMMPNVLTSTNTPVKTEEFHRIMIPPEAPTEGEKTKLLYLLGQNFLIKRQSKLSHLVSCKQIISHSDSSIFK
jgi:hypothetical protein